MISTGKGNFFVSHYEWIVAGVGALALVIGAAVFAGVIGGDGEDELPQVNLQAPAPKNLGVTMVDVSLFDATIKGAENPAQLRSVGAASNFMTCSKHVRCKCETFFDFDKVMNSEDKVCPGCKTPLIAVKQEDEEQKKRDAWAKGFGIAFDETDSDGDGFTNAEEYAMGTDPTDAKSSGNYLDALRLEMPLKKTPLEFYLLRVDKIPAGYRCNFKTKGGDSFSATVGEELEIVKSDRVGRQTKKPTGFKLIAAEKSEKKMKKNGIQVPVDASNVTIKRMSDDKEVVLVVSGAKPKYESVDFQATLVCDRLNKTFSVIATNEFELNGMRYQVLAVTPVGKDGAEVKIKCVDSGEERTIKAPAVAN